MQTLADSATETLDVRPVPPKLRCAAVLDAYRRLLLGDHLAFTVDHDPECTYDTLLAEVGADGFTFRYLERGPEVWRVVVACLRA